MPSRSVLNPHVYACVFDPCFSRSRAAGELKVKADQMLEAHPNWRKHIRVRSDCLDSSRGLNANSAGLKVEVVRKSPNDVVHGAKSE